ncbi:MAG: Ig-like domain-containing protein [Duncaniella sp.]|nr:Ig-like domain-containing protein [Duncaniella sp.]
MSKYSKLLSLAMGLSITAGSVTTLKAQDVFTDTPAEVVWAFNDPADYKAYTATPEGGFSVADIELGNVSIVGADGRSAEPKFGGMKFMKVKGANGPTDVIEWNVKPSAGLTFTPTMVSGYIIRFGTDAEHGVTVTAKSGDGESVVLGTFTAPRNNKTQNDDKYGKNEDYTHQFVINLTAEQQAQLATMSTFSLTASVGVNSSKEGGFADIHIAGKLNGTKIDLPKYNVNVSVVPEGGASVTLSPGGGTYEQGTKVTATATRAFGFKFVNWTDASGAVLTEEPSFDFTVEKDMALTANLDAIDLYELTLGVEGGANLYQVQAVPAGTMVDGRRLYESGATVTLQANSNPIVAFTNWSDGQSASEVTVKMDADKTMTGIFSAIDYVVGWDFWQPGASGRPADFVSDDNDNVSLVMRTADGTQASWLDKSEMAAGGYEGRPGAVCWKNDVPIGTYYWQTKINATAFKDLHLITAMVYNYNAYTTYDVEYSLDGETWTKIGSISMEGSKNWKDAEFDLPADASNKESVYIRIIADKNSPVAGTNSTNDGACLGATYITGTAQLVNDGTAPVLVSFVPAEASATASINGRIVLNFDEKVKLTAGAKATLGDNTLEGSVTGKTVVFPYKNLAYGTTYRFELKAGSVADLGDNVLNAPIVINFTTRTRPEIAKAAYDAVLENVDQLVEALAAAEKRKDKSVRYRIFIHDGMYRLPASATATKEGTDGKKYPDPTTYINAANISLIGESRDGVVITNTVPTATGSNPLEGIGKGDVMQLKGGATGTYFQDLTMKSSMGDAAGRDIVLNDQSDKTIAKNICLWAYQDTYVSNNSRARYYFEGGVLRGRTDYLCGKGDVYYKGVTLQVCGNGYLTAPSTPRLYGYVFKDCEIVGESASLNGNYTLGRPWGEGTPIALFIDTKMNIVPSAVGWNDMGSDGHPKRFAEYNSMTASGSPVDLSSRKTSFGPGKHANNPVLTQEEAEYHSYERVMGGDDNWDPASACEAAPLPSGLKLEGGLLTWKDDPYTLLWAVMCNGKIVGFTTEPSFEAVGATTDVWAVRSANEMGGLGEAVVLGSSSIDAAIAESEVVETIYFNLQGVRVDASAKGVVISARRLTDGSLVVEKIVK